jgi:Acetyltransferase (GNAT) domain
MPGIVEEPEFKAIAEPPQTIAFTVHPEPASPDTELQCRPPKGAVQPRKAGLSLLTSDEIPQWDALVEHSPQCSVFLKSWWLRAACSQVRILGYFESGQLIAGIPLHCERRLGLRICGMPKLTATLGMVMAPSPGKKVNQEARENKIMGLFVDWLSREPVFVQSFHPTCQNWLPFYWGGFSQTTHYTYVLDDLTALDRIWENMDRDRRTNIRKAQRLGLTVRECGPEVVFEAARGSFQRQRLDCPYSLQYLCRLYESARKHEAGVCMAAIDGNGKVHAAELFVWDAQRGYRLAGGHDTEQSSSGGAVLLVWSLIEFAAQRTAVFDFEGSMHKPIETSFRSFGARRVAYNRIARIPRWLRMGLCAAGRWHP